MKRIVIVTLSIFTFMFLETATLSSLAASTQTKTEISDDTSVNLINFAADAAVTMNSYNFAIYQKQFSKMSKYFTQAGWKQYQKTLKQSGNLETVINKKLVVSAVPTGPAVILGQEQEKGQTLWKIQIPLLVTYENATSNTKQPLLMTMKVVPAPEGKGVRNLLVDSVNNVIPAQAGTHQ